MPLKKFVSTQDATTDTFKKTLFWGSMLKYDGDQTIVIFRFPGQGTRDPPRPFYYVDSPTGVHFLPSPAL